MPPALSDIEDSSSGDDQIPPQRAGKDQPLEDNEEDEDSEGDEDEYVVEKILGHRFVKGAIYFDVKWQGYDDPKDRTWEPEDNMSGALDVLNEYYQDIGGKPHPKGQKRKAKKSESESRTSTPVSTAKRVKTDKEWSPPPGSWEHDVNYVDTVEERLNPKTGKRERFAYLIWLNERKTQHPLAQIYQKCPQKMLAYYERHLVFTGPSVDDIVNGDENDTYNGSDPTSN